MSFVPHHVIVEGDIPRKSVFVLHGIMGSHKNWRAFARRLVEVCPDWRAVLVDIRHHGGSKGAPAPDTLEACSEDLVRLEDSIGPCQAVVGHSFGGKVAAMHALRHGQRLESVTILDCPLSPSPTEKNDSEVARVIAALRSVEMPVARRADVGARLEAAGFSRSLAGWMATNLERTDDGHRWHFDLAGIERLIADYWATDAMPLLEDPPGDLWVHFVRAARSDRWSDGENAKIDGLPDDRRRVLTTVRDAGHWLHVDNPEGTLDAVSAALRVSG